MAKIEAKFEIVSDKSKNPVVDTKYVKHGDNWLDGVVNQAVSALNSKADKTYVDAELAKKANVSALDGKADAGVVAQLQATVNTKADASTVSALSERVTANTTKTVDLQSQIDNLVVSGGGDSNPEVVQARTDASGVTHATLKTRIDTEVTDLKSDLNHKLDEVKINEIVMTSESVSDGVFDNRTKTIVIPAVSAAYKCEVFDISHVTGNIEFEAYGSQPSTYYRAVVITDIDDNIVYQSDYTGSLMEITVNFKLPENANRLYLNSKKSMESTLSYKTITNDVSEYLYTLKDKDEIQNKLDKKLDVPEISKILEYADGFDGLYDYTQKRVVNPGTSTSYLCNLYDVEGISKIEVSGVQPSIKYRLYTVLDNDGNIIKYSPDDITGSGQKIAIVELPENAKTVYVNKMLSANEQDYMFEKVYDITELLSSQMTVKATSTGLRVYDGNYEFNWKLNGANSIMNFASAYYKGTNLFATNTDWIGPYDIVAINNADGDRLDDSKGVTSTNTTGGNHDIHSEVASGTTGRTVSYKIYADGKEISSGSDVKCTNAEIRWINRIQAGNTAKLDSTGRECLEEHGFARFLGNGLIEVGVTFKPLEDIKINWYSGLQFAGYSFAPDIYVPDYTNYYITPAEVRENRNNSSVSYAIANGTIVNLEMFMNRTYGMGKNTPNYYFDGNGTKCYFILFDRESGERPTLHANERYSWIGHYRFFCK